MLPRIITVLLLLFIGCWGQWGALAVKLRDSRVVNTKYGALKGVLVTPQDKHLHPVDVFLGVPYASPPIGKLRFMPPVSPNPWPGTRSAVTFGAVCPQRLPDIANETTAQNRLPKGRLHYLKRLFMYLKNQSEDCLYLNIFAPVRGRTNLWKHFFLFFYYVTFDREAAFTDFIYKKKFKKWTFMRQCTTSKPKFNIERVVYWRHPSKAYSDLNNNNLEWPILLEGGGGQRQRGRGDVNGCCHTLEVFTNFFPTTISSCLPNDALNIIVWASYTYLHNQKAKQRCI